VTTTLKILLYTAAVCMILFCATGVGFMFYHEQAAAQQADAQRAAIEAQTEQTKRARIEQCTHDILARDGDSPNTTVNAWQWCQ
jgi:hypothetical protein